MPAPFTATPSVATSVAACEKAAPVRTPRGWKHKYGLYLPTPLTLWQLELGCWLNRTPGTGLEPFDHLKNAAQLLLPESLWHDWREDRFRALCDDSLAYRVGNVTIRNFTWMGVGSAGKTVDAATFGFLFWLAAMDSSYVILTSTSKTKIRQRSWATIHECYSQAKSVMEATGVQGMHMLGSTMELIADRNADKKHAIFCQAILSGEIEKAVNNLKGVHADRICVVIDEADGTPEAIYKTVTNMLTACTELVLICCANGPSTHLDCFSKIAKPRDGWDSITIDSTRWETAAVPEFHLPPGVCFHFDGPKSPNVRAGETLYPFLYSWETWLRVKDNPDIQRTAEFWSQHRGFWTPEGFVNTVLTEQDIERGGARGKIEFAQVSSFLGVPGPTIPIGSCDPGFGGDSCVVRFGRLGRLSDGRLAVQIDERLIVPIFVDATDENGKRLPADYQITRFIMEQAPRRGVRPAFFGVESTGTGRGVAAILTQEWGEIVAVESGGAPTDMPASEEDEREARLVYDRKITELWFSVQAFVRGRQLGGLCEDDVIQFCSRTYTYEGKRYRVETKDDLKERLGRSPDDADSVAVLVHVARMHGLATKGPRAERMWNTWTTEIKAQQVVYDDRNLYLPETAEVW